MIGNNNRIKIGNNGNINGMSIFVVGDNNYVEIGNGVKINATAKKPACINCCHGSKLIVGNNVVLANNTELHTTDYHPIYDSDNNRINPEQDIVIGDHVWVGIRCLILKGTELQDDTIVGAGSIVTRKFYDKEIINSGYMEGEDDIYLAKSVLLENSVTKEFILLVWLNENGELQNSEMKKNLMGRIRIDASQKLD